MLKDQINSAIEWYENSLKCDECKMTLYKKLKEIDSE